MDLILTWETESVEKLRREFQAPCVFIVGRAPGCDLVLADERASRKHLSVRVAADMVQVTDLGSANGTLVNDKAIKDATLADGDRLLVGDTLLRVQLVPSLNTATERLDDAAAPTSKPLPPPVLGGRFAIAGYRFLRTIGQGAFGSVFEAEDAQGRAVAVKVVQVLSGFTEEDRRRFFREATTAAALSHPNVVRVLDHGQTGAALYLAMELVRGETVRSLIGRMGVLPITRALEITRGVAAALEAARAADLVHRDVKPDNILVDEDGFVKLADFGFAKSMATAGQSGLTQEGDVVGTVAYMSPEQLQSAVFADHRSDIYSLGATLYHMLAGETPFTARSNMEYFDLILNHSPAPIGSIRPEVPPIVRIMVEKCLRKKPEERYRTAAEIVRLLDVLLSSANDRVTHA